jgi:creatinine amidohydrolase/Fe(II)-dependent formamide hydrolase-like protein
MGALIELFCVLHDAARMEFETPPTRKAHAAEMVTSVALHLCPEPAFLGRGKPPAISPSPHDKARALPGNKVATCGSHFVNFANVADDSPMGLGDDPLPSTAEKGKTIWENAVAYGAEAVSIYSVMTPPSGVPA